MRWYARRASRGEPSPPHTWRNGLIIGPCHIGDVLYNTASLPALREGLPDCQWSYAVTGVSAQVLEGNPHLKEVISIPGFGPELKRSRAILAAYNFDVVLAYTSAPPVGEMRLALQSGIPNRIGYVHKGFSGLITHPVALHFPQPYPAYFRDLVSQLTGPRATPNPSLRPLVYLLPGDEAAAGQAATRLGLDWAGPPVLACAVTSRQPSGMWPQEQFLKTIQYVREREACTVVYTGAKSDAAQLQRLAERTGPNAFVLAGELELLPLVAFLRRCRAALAPDSGARHLANAAGIPVVFLRNLFTRKIETGAYCDTDHDMSPPELEMVEPAEQAAAFAAIDPAAVGEELLQQLRRR